MVKVVTVSVGVAEAELALMVAVCPRSATVAVFESNKTMRPFNCPAMLADVAGVNAEVGIEVVEALAPTVPRPIAGTVN